MLSPPSGQLALVVTPTLTMVVLCPVTMLTCCSPGATQLITAIPGSVRTRVGSYRMMYRASLLLSY